MNRTARLVIALAAPVAVGLAAASPASAYDCFNASRSGQGNAAASASRNWWSVQEFLAEAGLTPGQIAEILPVIEADPRVPDGFTVFFNPQHESELAAKAREILATNGKGIDHSDDYSTPVFEAIFEDAMSVLAG